MKKLILPLLLVGLILAGCSQKQGLSQEQLFQKKQECASYKDSLQKKIDQDTQDYKKTGGNYYENIDEIFYSSKENSCFAIVYIMSNFEGESNYSYQIIDLLSNEVINYNKTDKNQILLFTEKISRLKGE